MDQVQEGRLVAGEKSLQKHLHTCVVANHVADLI